MFKEQKIFNCYIIWKLTLKPLKTFWNVLQFKDVLSI